MSSPADPSDPAEVRAGEGAPEPGWIEPVLAEELPGLGILTTTVAASATRSPREVRQQLEMLSSRISGPQAIQLRQRPIPWAYRVFFRNVGLDPDETRTPIEEVVLERLQHGGHRSEDIVRDAIRIAIAETGVALRAFDVDTLEGRLGLRQSEPDESFAGRVSPLPDGTLVIADERRAVAYLFGRPAEGVEPSRRTKRVCLAAIQVAGVPDVAVEEAIWRAATILGD